MVCRETVKGLSVATFLLWGLLLSGSDYRRRLASPRMEYQQIRVDDRDEIRVITLDRPAKLNAWTPHMSWELEQAIISGNNNVSIGAFVVTGAGRAFCAGADISEVFASQLEDDDSAAPETSGADTKPLVEQSGSESESTDWVELMRSSKPIVAAINGASIGVGLTLTLSMDFLVAHPEAKLSCRFVKMGVVPELASSHYLVQRCGWGHASDLALSGRTVLGQEALDLGLIDEVAEDVVEAALVRARSYAENAPPSVLATKQLLTVNGSDTNLKRVQAREMEALAEAYRSDEHREAINAFLEKRPPSFR